MNHGWRHITLLLVVVLVLAACGTEEPFLSNDPGDDTATGGESDDSLPLDGAWVLIAATVDGTTLSLNDQYRVTMTIDGSEISGRAACNGYGGAVSIDNGTFSVGEIARTQMACEPAVMEIESTFMQGLFSVTNATRSGDTASLTGEGVEYTFELVPPVPSAELIGPTWVLDTIIQGDAASSTIATADPATLLLNADGTFTGGTGCREISGEYVVSGDTVQFTSFGTDGECRREVEWQDGQVVTVLEGGFTVEIDGDRLTVTASGGEGLSYKTGR
ncbi:MAG: META domain-containing protein [Acidimicrobiia bacterium]